MRPTHLLLFRFAALNMIALMRPLSKGKEERDSRILRLAERQKEKELFICSSLVQKVLPLSSNPLLFSFFSVDSLRLVFRRWTM